MMNTQSLLQIVQLVLASMNVCVLLFAFFKFLGKPHDTLETRVTECEVKIREHERSLNAGKDKFAEHDRTNEVLIRSSLALIEFEIQYCISEKKPMSRDLEKARDDLHDYLSRK